MWIPSSEAVSAVCGTIGGVLLGIGLIPQVMHIVQRRSAEDVSYRFMLLHGSGLAFFIAYLVLENAVIGFLFSLLELGLTLTVIGLKYYYANNYVEPISVRQEEFASVKHVAIDYVLPPGCLHEGANKPSVQAMLKHCIYAAGTSCRFKSTLKDGHVGPNAYYASAFLENSRFQVFVTANVFINHRLLSIDVQALPILAESEQEQAAALEELVWQIGDELWRLGIKARDAGLDADQCRPQLHNRQQLTRFDGVLQRTIHSEKSDAALLQMVEIDARGF